MVYVGAEYSPEDLFREIMEKARYERVRDFAEYSELVDSLIEEKKSYGFLVDEEDLEQLKQGLQMRWNEVEEKIA